MQRHAHQAFTRFLGATGNQVTANKQARAVLDSYAAPKHSSPSNG